VIGVVHIGVEGKRKKGSVVVEIFTSMFTYHIFEIQNFTWWKTNLMKNIKVISFHLSSISTDLHLSNSQGPSFDLRRRQRRSDPLLF
jgi:predicted membrane chloride channel (bestrophin family)